MVLGIAFSGPYQLAGNFALSIGQTRSLGPYSITLKDIYKGENAAYSFYQAELDISRNGEQTGTLFTERRKYFKYAKAFSKADSLFTLGSEAYASLLGINEKNTTARLHLSINPQINWIWIGGFLLCLCPLLQLLLSRKHRG
jgi:cytochrome c-type biogenesis protein CcmF